MGNKPTISLDQYEANRARLTCGKEICDGSRCSKVAEKFLHAYNMRDRKTMHNVIAEGATFSFKGADACLSLDLFIPQIEMIQDSFPDVFVSWDEICELELGVVSISNVYSRGTHTGAPFAYPPFPAIPATGKVVEEGPSQLVYLIENGKLRHIQLELAPGDLSGPAGYYTKIGGKIEMTE